MPCEIPCRLGYHAAAAAGCIAWAPDRPHSTDTHLRVYVNERFQGSVRGMVRTLQVEWEGPFGWPRGEHVVRIAICDADDRVRAQQSVLFQKR